MLDYSSIGTNRQACHSIHISLLSLCVTSSFFNSVQFQFLFKHIIDLFSLTLVLPFYFCFSVLSVVTGSLEVTATQNGLKIMKSTIAVCYTY